MVLRIEKSDFSDVPVKNGGIEGNEDQYLCLGLEKLK
jgi:hypothetical protein